LPSIWMKSLDPGDSLMAKPVYPEIQQIGDKQQSSS
jgi:hypothetical protein